MQRAIYARGLRFLPKLAFITTVALVSAAISYQASAQNVYTDPVGFITLTAVGTISPGSSPANSFWGLGMTPIPSLRGVVTTVTTNQLAVSGLVAGAYNQGAEGPLYYIEDVNSNSTFAGFTDDIVANDANYVYLANNDAAFIAANDNFKIYPHWTLASLFGATDTAGLQPGSSSTADLILLQNPVAKTFTTYYYATASKTVTAGWKNGANGADASNVPLYGDQGLVVSRKVGTNLNVQVVGAVKLGVSQIPLIGPGNTFVGNQYASSGITLGTSGLYIAPGNQSNSVVAGSSSTADLVLIHNDAAGTFATYYYATASKTVTAGWKNAANGADATNVQLPLGADFVFTLKTGHFGWTWAAPSPY
jgi:uncharacterized protein (TIGR02597 family)